MNKIDRVIREIILYFVAIFFFPFMTIRALIWRWHFWLQKMDKKIKDNDDEFYGKSI